jgi:hypothetical protein
MYKEEFTIETCKPTLIIYTVFARLKITCVMNKGNNKITELRTILQRESQNS